MKTIFDLFAITPYLVLTILGVVASAKAKNREELKDWHAYFNIYSVLTNAILGVVLAWVCVFVYSVYNPTAERILEGDTFGYILSALGWVWLLQAASKGQLKVWYVDFTTKK